MTTRGLRRIRIGEASYRWRVYHQEKGQPGRAGPVTCAEVFAAWLDGYPRAGLRLRFPEGPEHGPSYPRQSGLVIDHREPGWWALLHRPRTAELLIGIAHREGWAPAGDPTHELVLENGFEVVRRYPEVIACLADDVRRAPPR